MTRDQRDAQVRWVHPLDDTLTLVSARTKHDRRYRALVAQDGNQILKEWWPITDIPQAEAEAWLDGYRFAKAVWATRPVNVHS